MAKFVKYSHTYCKNCINRYIKLTCNTCNLIHITAGANYNEIICKDSKGSIIENKIKLSAIANE